MDRFINPEKSKLYLVYVAMLILILLCMHPNDHCIADIMETGRLTLP